MTNILVGAGLSATAAGMVVNTAVSVGLGLLQRALTPDQVIQQQGARLDAARVTSSTEGATMPLVVGRSRIGGQLIWSTGFTETIVTTTESQGGKGGPKVITETTEYVYSVSFAIGLCQGGSNIRLGRIWVDGNLLDTSLHTYRFYSGTTTQTADPKIVEIDGDLAPAYRDTCYIVFEDMVLTDYGNRIPQITCEIINSLDLNDSLEPIIEAVAFGNGEGSMALPTEVTFRVDEKGVSYLYNMNNQSNEADTLVSLDTLETLAPALSKVTLPVSWFHLSGTTDTKPYQTIIGSEKTIPLATGLSGRFPTDWRVSDRVVPDNYATGTDGTPSDHSVREAITEMKSRGITCVFEPRIASVTSHSVTGGGTRRMLARQWAGDLTLSAGDLTSFLGTAATSDFTAWDGTEVAYSGPSEWTYRRMVLHYATLLSDVLESGDVFLVGTEMLGLTEGHSAWGTALATLMTDVRSILPAGVLVSYASDWREYDHANLSPVWSSADFIGINYAPPVTDWRVTSDETYDITTLKAGLNSGEYWDWYYASESDRNNSIKTPITVAADRQKDIRSWATTNYPADDIWFTRVRCRAVDKATNQPDVFTGTDPWFSDGSRDDLIQRLYLTAVIDYWTDDGLVAPGNIIIDGWDARPFPSFPFDARWYDYTQWGTGHWLTGRLGRTVRLHDVIADLFETAGISRANLDFGLLDDQAVSLRGMLVGSLTDTKAILDNLRQTFVFDYFEDGDTVRFVTRSDPATVTIDIDDLVLDGDSTYVRTRVQDKDLPDRIKVSFLDETRDYNPASVDSPTRTGYSRNISTFTSICALSIGYAQSLADVLIQEEWIGRERLRFRLPFSSEYSGKVYLGQVKNGTVFTLLGRQYRVERIVTGDDLDVSAVAVNTGIYDDIYDVASGVSSGSILRVGRPVVVAADLPLKSETQSNQWSPRLVTIAEPKPSAVIGYVADGSGGYVSNTSIRRNTIVGETLSSFPAPSAIGEWDETTALSVTLYGTDAALYSASDLSVLNGANMAAVRDANGKWEVFQFANVTSVIGGYSLSRLIRGRLGTDQRDQAPVTIASGAPFLIYDATTMGYLGGDLSLLNQELDMRFGPSGVDLADDRYLDVTITPTGEMLRPWAPVSLKQTYDSVTGDIALEWKRRTRFGDHWGFGDVPLNEESERYYVEIRNGTGHGATVLRAIETTDPSYTYSAADILSDHGSAETAVHWTVAQMSAIVGVGHKATFD